MSPVSLVVLLFTVILMIYLIFALLFPEKF